MKNYIKHNLLRGLATSPLKAPVIAWLAALPFLALIMLIGFATGLLEYGILQSNLKYILPFTMIIMPSLLEESVFRGLLIPRESLQAGWPRTILYLLISTVLFTLWHPLNAIWYNHTAIALFTNPWFLLQVALLGLACGTSYVLSKSLWLSVIIHWITVMAWVIILGGRNFIVHH